MTRKSPQPTKADVAYAKWMRERPVNAYVNAAYQPRQCDRCGTTYRGPAVYCCLECAIADAK